MGTIGMKNKPNDVESKKQAQLCANEINVILAKYSCRIDVEFVNDSVMGQPVLRYSPVINHTGK